MVADISDLFFTVDPGREVRLPTSNVEKCGNVIAVSNTREGAVSAAETAVSELEVVLVPRRKSTTSFLFDEAGGHWAFPLHGMSSNWLRIIRVHDSSQPMERFGVDRDWYQDGHTAGPVGIGQTPAGPDKPDWAWRTLAQTVTILRSDGLVRTDRFDDALAPLVWRGILRGGLQGGRYVIRSLTENP